MSAAVDSLRVKNFDLTGTMAWQRDCLQKKTYDIRGRMTELRLGIDARAEYCRGGAWARVSRTSKVLGLTLSWPADDAPWIAFAPDKQTMLFPGGIQRPPKCAVRELRLMKMDVQSKELPPGLKWRGSELVGDDKRGYTTQDMADYASGKMTGRDGSKFAILQPLEQIILLANVRSGAFGSAGTMLNVQGSAAFDGRHPALLMSVNSPEAYIVGGMWTFADS